MLGEEELSKPPFNVENQVHRRAVLAELDRMKLLGVKPPQNLWEYKVNALLSAKANADRASFLCCGTQEANAGKSLFLLYSLKRSPRLTLFYLYLFDYAETFLPFLHTCCPALAHAERSESVFLNRQVSLGRLTLDKSAPHLLICRPCVNPLLLLLLFAALLPSTAGAQFGPVGGVSPQVPAAAVPADSRVCLGLAVRALLDVALRDRQHRAAVGAGRLRPVEALGGS